ncbi:H-2 class II histocompatibility antigen, A-U alpha chain-like [Embiotoca jacksoni]|uniref:H-2 class II histocompatibility antigen, A-U alpha chain-like n=1 Tax=Embiotoca jacksoni TaxID=100190 RepID=UPI003703C548
MAIHSSHTKCSAVIILMVNSFCAFSQITHEVTYYIGCFENSTAQVLYEFDGNEMLYIDFERHSIEYTLPVFLVFDPSKVFQNLKVYSNGLKAKRACPPALQYCKLEASNPPEEKDPPDSVMYPAEEVELGVENSLICLVNHFYPPSIKVSWTKNNHPVSEGVSLSRYYPNNDQTFHQFSTLTFTPSEGDIYSCTVEHSALERPQTKIWEPEFSHQSLGLDVFCGVGLSLGLLGVATGTFLFVKGLQRE